ncbi:MAG: glycosyl transferase group 1 [Akkermansiaceae bacterium]|nr:glycosyl transferase group 1 [Akkermansiaceae bacterium]
MAADDWFRPCEDVVELDAIRARYGIPPGPYLLSVCTLAPHKNLAHVIRCFSRLVAEEGIRDLNLVLVGAKGWNYDSIFNAIDFAPGTRERIIVTGYVPDEDLSPLYSGALAFVFCSLYEGFGLPPLEAMQCGVPVITSNTSSLPEVVGEAGMMVDPSDEDQLCQAMLDVYEDSDLRTSLKSKSVARAAQSSWERCVGQVIEGYKRALA